MNITSKVLQRADLCRTEVLCLHEGPCLRKSQSLHQWIRGELSQHCVDLGAMRCHTCQRKSFIASKRCSSVKFRESILFIFVCSTAMLKQPEALGQIRHVFLANSGLFLSAFLPGMYLEDGDWVARSYNVLSVIKFCLIKVVLVSRQIWALAVSKWYKGSVSALRFPLSFPSPL